MIIQSAGVSQNAALVDSQGRLQAFAAVEQEDRHINQQSGKVWSVPFTLTTTGANAYVQYIENTGTKNLHVTDWRGTNTGTASVITFESVTGDPLTTSALTPVSRKLGTLVVMAADNYTASAGTGITGLTSAGLLFPKFMKAGDEVRLTTSSNIIIPPGAAMAVNVATSGAIIIGSLSVVEVEPESGI